MNDLSESLQNESYNFDNYKDKIDFDSLSSTEAQDHLFFQRYQNDTNDRKWLSKWTAIIVSLWLVLILIILWLHGYNSNDFNLSNSIVITLLGTTTLNVLGLSLIVLRGHFNNKKLNH